MIDEEKIMPFNFFAYGGVYSGVHGGMRYRLFRTGEKPDFSLRAAVWQGPYAYAAAAKEQRTEKDFPYHENGRREAVAWIKEQYESRQTEWADAPGLLDAPVNLEAIYRQESPRDRS